MNTVSLLNVYPLVKSQNQQPFLHQRKAFFSPPWETLSVRKGRHRQSVSFLIIFDLFLEAAKQRCPRRALPNPNSSTFKGMLLIMAVVVYGINDKLFFWLSWEKYLDQF